MLTFLEMSTNVTADKPPKTTVSVFTETFNRIDSLREVYRDGTKEKWDHFWNRVAALLENKEEVEF